MSDRAWDSSINSCFLSFHSLSCSSTVRPIELGIGLIELEIGLRINNAGAPSWPMCPALFMFIP